MNDFLKHNIRLLVVDDDTLFLETMSHLLTRMDVDFTTVSNGDEAVIAYGDAYANSKAFDAALIDLDMSIGPNGRELMEMIKKIDPDARLIAISGFSDDPMIENYKDFGLAGSLAKPFNRDELKAVLSSVFASI